MLVDAVPSVTAVEVDERLAADLAAAYPAVDVVHGSGDALPFDDGRRGFHAGDTYVPVDPDGLPARLRAAGFRDVTVEVPDPEFFTFAARP